MATNLQPLGRIPGGRRNDWQTARWLVGLAVVAVLLGLGALGAGTPIERAAPGVQSSSVSTAGERPVFDGHGKWTGY